MNICTDVVYLPFKAVSGFPRRRPPPAPNAQGPSVGNVIYYRSLHLLCGCVTAQAAVTS